MKKHLRPLAWPLGLDLLMTMLYLMMVGGDQSISIIILFFIPALALISLIVGIMYLLKKNLPYGIAWLVNVLVGVFVMIYIPKPFYNLHHRAKYVNYVCYGVKATRWNTFSQNFELEITRNVPVCQICSFDERYPSGGYSSSSDYHHGTYSINPDGSYLLIFEQDTLVLRNDTLYGLADKGVRMEKQ